jgi:hypothetical protein
MATKPSRRSFERVSLQSIATIGILAASWDCETPPCLDAARPFARGVKNAKDLNLAFLQTIENNEWSSCDD